MQLEKLLVLVDRPIRLPSPSVLAGVHFKNVTSAPYDADASGATDTTRALQKALDDTAAGSSMSYVYLPPGRYTTSASLTIPSNTTLFVDAGAVIKTTGDPQKVPLETHSCTQDLVPLLQLQPGASTVAIVGNGRLDANGFALMAKDTAGSCPSAKGWLRRRRLLASAHGSGPMRDITLRGITLADATTWTIAVEDVDRMVVDQVKVLNHANVTTAKIENDGLDLISTRDAVVQHSFVITVDDAMCAKGSAPGAALRNTSFIDNVVYTSCAGNKAGFQAEGPYSDVVFRGTDVLHARRGVVVQSVQGSSIMRNVSFEDIRVEVLASVQAPAGAHHSSEGRRLRTGGGFEAIRAIDIEAGSASISGVTLKDCHFTLTPAQEAAGYYGTIEGSHTTPGPNRANPRGVAGASATVSGVAFHSVLVNSKCIRDGSHLTIQNSSTSGITYQCVAPSLVASDHGRLLFASTCKTELDCSLNGKCTASGACSCNPMWKGPACATLNLLPATKLSGLRTVEKDGKNTSSWGGQVLQGSDGKWHMLAAEITNHCGINAWTRNSRVIHAVSDTAGGLYQRLDEVRPVFAHEPTFSRAPDGTYISFYTSFLPGTKRAPPCTCTDGSTPKTCKNGEMSKDPTFMTTSRSLAGPWSNGTLVPLLDCNRTFCQHDMNLQGVIFANNSFVGLVKVHGVPKGASHSISEIHRVTADDWRAADQYKQTLNDESGNTFPGLELIGLEDPHVYLDSQGRYHALFHEESGLDSGAHACSYVFL